MKYEVVTIDAAYANETVTVEATGFYLADGALVFGNEGGGSIAAFAKDTWVKVTPQAEAKT